MAGLVLAGLLASPSAGGREMSGKSFEESVTRAGKTLKLSGIGLREKYFVDVYVLGVYTVSGGCDASRLVATDEVKLLRLQFVRKVQANRMEAETRKMTMTRLPASLTDQDREQAEAFIRQMTVSVTGDSIIEMLYVPGTGTSVTKDGKSLGPTLTGKPFQEVLWNTYLGPSPCCPKTTKQILESCRGG